MLGEQPQGLSRYLTSRRGALLLNCLDSWSVGPFSFQIYRRCRLARLVAPPSLEKVGLEAGEQCQATDTRAERKL